MEEMKAEMRSRGSTKYPMKVTGPKKHDLKAQTHATENTDYKDTVRSSQTLHRKDLHIVQQSYTTESSTVFWNEAVFHMGWDDPIVQQDILSSGFGRSKNATLGIYALKRAAKEGHHMAQFYLANALAAGFWMFDVNDSSDLAEIHSLDVGALTVQESWIPNDSNEDNYSLNQAYLLWHASAMSGNVEAAMTLASRLEFSDINSPSSRSKVSSTCSERLPYWAAAAHGTMDELLADPSSRGRTVQAKDKHVLYQVHLHGGTTSRLDLENRPDESADALQYYQLKVDEGQVPGAPQEVLTAGARAAFTLAQFYQIGLRGAPHDVDLALKYFEIAAELKHWEAAGRAGHYYLWGMRSKRSASVGDEDETDGRDPIKAHKLFRIGTPNGLESCQSRWSQFLKQNKRKKDQQDPDQAEIHTCDAGCLTGMGLLHLWGVPMLVPVDIDTATAYLKIAKEQGDADAPYYLAMMKMGWHTHFKSFDEASKQPQTLIQNEHFLSSGENHPTIAEYQEILSELTNAAGKGHLQARHRLAMLYEKGVTLSAGQPGSVVTVIKNDCEKAKKHYRAFLEQASPHRSKRLRRAYTQYVAGETSKSMRNYLIAAETGSELGLLNAAFLIERGECVGTLRSNTDCAKAAVRLWKAAATLGYSEASLRVGDFFFFGRFREGASIADLGLLGWLHYLVFPEKLVPVVFNACNMFAKWLQGALETQGGEATVQQSAQSVSCEGINTECYSPDVEIKHTLEKDLASAAQFYRMAAERSANPRAHFNLGFLYQWGLGLTQDFPLAKRHYDLAVSSEPQEAEVPVLLALFALQVHEYVVKLWMSWNSNDAAVAVEGSTDKEL